jgi:putative oxidoreductase
LILLGGWTRWVAVLLSGEMAIAYFVVHAPQSPFPLVNHGEAAILFCFIFLMLAVVGPGKWSIDEARAKRHSDIWGYAAPGGERPGLDEE